MTIAAGFHHKDGVLLCADTEHQSWAMKSIGPKIVPFSWRGGRGAFTFAGNSAFATAAIQKSIGVLEKSKKDDPLEILESSLRDSYQKTVFKHPDQSFDVNVHYWLLAAIPSPSSRVELYYSHQGAWVVENGVKCIGIGDSFAEHLLCPMPDSQMTERTAVHLASYVLRIVKENVTGCGGPTNLWSVRDDGSASDFAEYKALSHIEDWASGFFSMARDLFLAHLGSDEQQWRQESVAFNQKMGMLRGVLVDELNGQSCTSGPRD